jgi:hypothetical protein
MALLKPEKIKETTGIKAQIDIETEYKAKQYIEFAGLHNIDELIEKSLEFLFSKDKEFKNHMKMVEEHQKSNEETTE